MKTYINITIFLSKKYILVKYNTNNTDLDKRKGGCLFTK